MRGLALVLVIVIGGGLGLGLFAWFGYQRSLRRAKAIERGLKMVPLQIHPPPPSDDTEVGSRDVRDVVREKVSQAEVLYSLISGTAKNGLGRRFYGQRHIALELVATRGLIHFYAAVPVSLVSAVEQAIVTAYPGARVEETEDHNIFNQSGRLSGTMGGELTLKHESAYPIATYSQLERDPMEALVNTLSSLGDDEGAALQYVIRPALTHWTRRALAIVRHKRRQSGPSGGLSATDVALAVVKAPEQRQAEEHTYASKHPLTGLEETAVQAIEEKTKHPGFDVMIRVVVSTASATRSQGLISDIATAFALFEAPGLNGFQFLPAADSQGLVTAFIFRFFPPNWHRTILNSVELATLFHLPDAQFTPSMSVEREMSKQADGPAQVSATGLLLGTNAFRGVKKDIHLSTEDRRRHLYIVGQTGTGKSTMLENLVVQDMLAGNGLAFIDPHGDTAEKLLGLVPKSRSEDVIYFNPADMDYPLGLNLFEFDDPAQKDFLIQESINMLYKIYDPGKTGIIGPRFEQWYRNAALTIMSDPAGATFIEIPKVFTDTDYLKRKFRYLQDPTVIDFWTKEMGQTSDYHKSEMLGWFASKFGAFMNNEMMRNILGQTKSSFNLRDVMDNRKILIVNLSKGRIGELNAQLLGMIFVIKFQAAAMSRAAVLEEQRPDFCLYVDEFQNFSTDSFASILSEARKYRLNLIVANQFIGQLSNEIRDAVFGNIGTIASFRCGPEDAEFLVKQFAPIFDARDLVNLPNFNSIVKLLIGGLPSQPFSMQGLPFLSNSNPALGLAIKQLSAAKFGHARAEVEAAIFGRFSGKPVGETQPSVAGLPSSAVRPPSAPTPQPAPLSAPAQAPTPVVPANSQPLASPPRPAPNPAPLPPVAPPPSPGGAGPQAGSSQGHSTPATVEATRPLAVPAPSTTATPSPPTNTTGPAGPTPAPSSAPPQAGGPSIADIVKIPASRPKPVFMASLPTARDGDASSTGQPPSEPVASPSPPPLVSSSPPKQIVTNVPPPSPPQSAPAVETEEKPAADAIVSNDPASSTEAPLIEFDPDFKLPTIAPSESVTMVTGPSTLLPPDQPPASLPASPEATPPPPVTEPVAPGYIPSSLPPPQPLPSIVPDSSIYGQPLDRSAAPSSVSPTERPARELVIAPIETPPLSVNPPLAASVPVGDVATPAPPPATIIMPSPSQTVSPASSPPPEPAPTQPTASPEVPPTAQSNQALADQLTQAAGGSTSTAPGEPLLQPGEISVDDDGTIHQG